MGKRPEETFFQRNKQTYEKRLNITNHLIQVKTTMRYHLIPVKMAITKNSTNKKCWRGCRQKGTVVHC